MQDSLFSYKTVFQQGPDKYTNKKIIKNRKYNIYTLYMKNINDDSLWKHST